MNRSAGKLWLAQGVGVAVLGITAGCSAIVIEGDTSDHYLVIGAGIVSVPKADDAEAPVSVSKVQALGLTVSQAPTLKFNLGYVAGSSVRVPADARNLVVEVSDKPGGPLRIAHPPTHGHGGPHNASH